LGNHVISYLTWRCGLGCPYCAYYTQPDNLSVIYRPAGKVFKVSREMNGQEWLDLLLPFKADVYDFCGGEALLHPDFAQITHGIPHWAITSNTLGDFKSLNLKACRSWTASYHPHVGEAGRQRFKENVRYLKAHGVNTSITMVAEPHTVEQVILQCDAFAKEGFNCNIHPYYDEPGFSWNYSRNIDQWSKLMGVSYTCYDKKLMSWNQGGVRGRNKVCNAGHNYFVIAPDGRIFPCFWGMLSGQVAAVSGPSPIMRACSIPCQCACDFVYGLGVK